MIDINASFYIIAFPKPRYRVHARKYKPLLHCTKSLKRDHITVVCLKMANEHSC